MKGELELYGQLVAKPKTSKINCEYCGMPIDTHGEKQFKNYTSYRGCELYGDWMDIVSTGQKYTRDEWLSIVETSLKNKYPDVQDWSSLVDELLFVDIDDLGVLTREGELIWRA